MRYKPAMFTDGLAMSALRFHSLPSPFAFKRGGGIAGARVAYETWGRLSAARDNAVLILTGLSPGAHAASSAGDPSLGWWEEMIGPGRAIDTDRFYVICPNSLGSCKGSTGPASIDPATGEAYATRFPELSIEDIAAAARDLVAAIGIQRLAAVVGPSMGGMTAQALALAAPALCPNLVLISTAAHAEPFALAVRSLQREAIRADPAWNGGHYSDARWPERGMRLARKLGVITYRSPAEWKERFARARIEFRSCGPFDREFQIESYLESHATRFVGAFDPNAYLYLSRAMDWFDLAEYAETAEAAYARMAVERALVIGVESDILFPLGQQAESAEGLRFAGAEVRFESLASIQGHDAFLVDFRRFAPPVAAFMGEIARAFRRP